MFETQGYKDAVTRGHQQLLTDNSRQTQALQRPSCSARCQGWRVSFGSAGVQHVHVFQFEGRKRIHVARFQFSFSHALAGNGLWVVEELCSSFAIVATPGVVFLFLIQAVWRRSLNQAPKAQSGVRVVLSWIEQVVTRKTTHDYLYGEGSLPSLFLISQIARSHHPQSLASPRRYPGLAALFWSGCLVYNVDIAGANFLEMSRYRFVGKCLFEALSV